ncbi:MAG: class I SAM-dependent methyltransferase [Anaerolineae bacterium]
MANVESRIRERFDDVSQDRETFPAHVEPDDFEWLAVKRALGLSTGAKVLDAGCGRGRFSRALAGEGARVVGVDLSHRLTRAAAQLGGDFCQASVTRLPFAAESFDAVVCVEVLEHVPDVPTALAEMARVLCRGGKAVVVDKSLCSLHPRFLLPSALVKFVMERANRWMYPSGFEFAEIWFVPRVLSRQLRMHFSGVEVCYLHYTYRKWRARGWITRLLPFLSMYVAWVAEK